MLNYALQRIGLAIVIVFLVVFALFVMIHFIPGDPVAIALGPRATPEIEARFVAKMRLDEPLYMQFFAFLGGVLQGDLGNDIFSERPVLTILFEALPYTVILATAAMAWSAALGIFLGCFSAARPNSLIDRITGVVSIGTITVPSFVVSIYMLIVFAVFLKWLPVIGAGEPGNFWDQARHLILPAFAVGLGWVGYVARMVRASMLEVIGENHIRAARSFGLPHRVVVYRYALKVAILPTITLLGIGFGNLLSGAVFAEIIFSRPGIGKLIFDMVMTRNFPVVQGGVLVTAILYVATTLTADLLAAAMDPRIRKSL
ncbi:MAG: ABC transporter permease [Albidovulum sp.]|nr:ABC transporter permease [Albidovulum sp.]